MDILRSSLTGNIVGILSLLIGIIGVIITVRTMKSAKRIEFDIKEAKIKALDKKRFNKDREGYLKKLNTKRNAASRNKVLSYSLCNDVLSIINDLKGYDILTVSDKEMMEQKWDKLRDISLVLQEDKNSNEILQDFDVIVSSIINILSKGEYDL